MQRSIQLLALIVAGVQSTNLWTESISNQNSIRAPSARDDKLINKLKVRSGKHVAHREQMVAALANHPKLESRRSEIGSIRNQITRLVTPVETDPLSVENEINDRLGAPNNTVNTEEWEQAPVTANSTPEAIQKDLNNNTTPQEIEPVRPTPVSPTPVANETDANDEEVVKKNHTRKELSEWEKDQKDIDETFEYIDALLQGFRYHQTLRSGLRCSRNFHQTINRMRNLTYSSWPFKEDDQWPDYIFDTTGWVSHSIAPTSKFCYLTVLEGWQWGRVKVDQFPDGFDDFFPAWLQSLLGNVVTVNSIRKKIEMTADSGDDLAKFYWYGRLIDIFMNFEPIDIDDDALDMAEDENWQRGDDDDERRRLRAMPDPTFQVRRQRKTQINTRLRLTAGEGVDLQDEAKLEDGNDTNAFNQVWAFTIGMINSTFGDNSPSADVCHSNISKVVNSTRLFAEMVQTGEPKMFNQSADEAENFFASWYPATFGCYASIFEMKNTLVMYMDTFSSWQRVLYNLMHKLGEIYDAIYFIVKHHSEHEEKTTKGSKMLNLWWYKLGSYYGIVFKLFFYTDSEPDPQDPAEDLKWESGF